MEHKIRVMQITNNLGIGGLERVVVNLCKHLNKDMFEVSVCCLSFRGPFAEELMSDGIPVFLSPHLTEATDYLAFWKLKNILRSVNPHIVHTHNINAMFDGFFASILAGIPINIHTDHGRIFPDKMRYMVLEGIISIFLDHIIVVSEQIKENLIHYEHIANKKITVVNNGIDGHRYDISIDIAKKKQELGLDSFTNIIGLGVRLTQPKGITYLIQASPLILERYPQTAFVIAGEGDLMSALKKETRKFNVDSHFIFLGPRLDLNEILQLFDIYVLPSISEGFPLVILEAMAAGKAIVATNVGGIPLAINDCKEGFLVPPKDPQMLANKICELLGNEDKRIIFSKNAKQKFYNEFEVRHMIKEYEQIYLRSIKKKGISV